MGDASSAELTTARLRIKKNMKKNKTKGSPHGRPFKTEQIIFVRPVKATRVCFTALLTGLIAKAILKLK